MKTLVTTKAKATKATASVRKFTVSERWIEITVNVTSSHFDRMKGQKSYSPHWHAEIVRNYFTRLAIVIGVHRGGYAYLGVVATKSFEDATQEYRIDAGIWGDMRGRRNLVPFTFVLQESEWQKMIEHAARIGAKPEALVRAALAGRVRLWLQMSANEEVNLSFTVPVSEIRDFRAYMANLKWVRDNHPHPELFSILVGTLRESERSQMKPFNKPFNGVPSNKARLARTLKLMKVESCETITVKFHRATMNDIEENAKFYGISPAQHCQACISYHAALWRKRQEKNRPKSPFERFERSLGRQR